MSQQQVNITDLDIASLQQVKTQLEEVAAFFFCLIFEPEIDLETKKRILVGIESSYSILYQAQRCSG